MNALEATQVTVRFGGLVAVDCVDFTVGRGEVVGLIGPNGSGKTSLLDAISGFEPYDGSMRLSGSALDGEPAHVRARRGLARTFQGLELFDDLTVGENVGVGRRDEHAVDAALAAVGAGQIAGARVSELDNVQRRLVALARALAGEPQVVLVDEVVAGLDAQSQTDIARCLRGVAGRGVGIALVDHNLDLVLGVADRVVVLDHGRVIADGVPQQIRNDPQVIAAYLGTTTP